MLGRQCRETPVISPAIHIIPAYLSDAGEGRQQHTAGLQCAMAIPDRCFEVIKKREGLSADYAIEHGRGNVLAGLKVPNYGGAWITGNSMQHLGSFHSIVTKLKGVVVICDLEDVTFYVGIVFAARNDSM